MSIVSDEDARWSHAERSVQYSIRVHELHVKYYQRMSILLSVLGIIGLSAPLSKAFGGDDATIYVGATIFFIMIQAIDWQVKPGEKAGLHAAKASEFRRLARRARYMKPDDLDDEWQVICDNDLTESENVRKIAYINSAAEQGYIDEVLPENRVLTPFQRCLWALIK